MARNYSSDCQKLRFPYLEVVYVKKIKYLTKIIVKIFGGFKYFLYLCIVKLNNINH